MASVDHDRATLDELESATFKAELIDGRIVPLMPTGRRPNRVAGNIYVGLRQFERLAGEGEAYTDNIGYVVPELPSGRGSFSLTSPTASAHSATSRCDCFAARPRSPSRSAATATTDPPPSERWPPRGPIASPPGPWSSGTSTPRPIRSVRIGDRKRTSKSSPAARSPTRSPPCRGGGSPWTRSSPDPEPILRVGVTRRCRCLAATP